MADSTMLDQLKALIGNDDEVLLETLLSIAKDHVLSRLYPYDLDKTIVPPRYQTKVVEIGVYLYNKQGAEGQVAHDENGIRRVYESASVPESMLGGVTPYVGVM